MKGPDIHRKVISNPLSPWRWDGVKFQIIPYKKLDESADLHRKVMFTNVHHSVDEMQG